MSNNLLSKMVLVKNDEFNPDAKTFADVTAEDVENNKENGTGVPFVSHPWDRYVPKMGQYCPRAFKLTSLHNRMREGP